MSISSIWLTSIVSSCHKKHIMWRQITRVVYPPPVWRPCLLIVYFFYFTDHITFILFHLFMFYRSYTDYILGRVLQVLYRLYSGLCSTGLIQTILGRVYSYHSNCGLARCLTHYHSRYLTLSLDIKTMSMKENKM